MKLRIDVDIEQVVEGAEPPASVVADRTVDALKAVSFPVNGITHAIAFAEVVYNAGEDPNAPEGWKKR